MLLRLMEFGQEAHSLTMHRRTEHIDAAGLFHPITAADQNIQVAGEACRLAGNVDHAVDAIGDDLRERFRMNAVARRIQNDEIRFF